MDSCIDAVGDFMINLIRIVYATEESKKKESMDEFLAGFYPLWLNAMENRLKKNESPHFFVGKELTIADLQIVHLISSHIYSGKPYAPAFKELFDKHPALAEYAEYNLNNTFKEYIEKRPKRLW